MYKQKFHRLLLSRKPPSITVPDEMLNPSRSKVKTPDTALKLINGIYTVTGIQNFLLYQIMWHALFHVSSIHQNTGKHYIVHKTLQSSRMDNPQTTTFIKAHNYNIP
jgi:hypothetical protein